MIYILKSCDIHFFSHRFVVVHLHSATKNDSIHLILNIINLDIKNNASFQFTLELDKFRVEHIEQVHQYHFEHYYFVFLLIECSQTKVSHILLVNNMKYSVIHSKFNSFWNQLFCNKLINSF